MCLSSKIHVGTFPVGMVSSRLHMPRRVSVCMRPSTSTPPSGVLVVHHVLPRHVGLCVGHKHPTTLWVAQAP